MLQKESFGFNGGLTACASGADSLAIDRVSTVTSNEDAREFGAWRTVNLL